jgi:hypothetical protein
MFQRESLWQVAEAVEAQGQTREAARVAAWLVFAVRQMANSVELVAPRPKAVWEAVHSSLRRPVPSVSYFLVVKAALAQRLAGAAGLAEAVATMAEAADRHRKLTLVALTQAVAVADHPSRIRTTRQISSTVKEPILVQV